MRPVKKEFTAWQRMALALPHDVDITDEPDPVCMHLPAKGRSVILTCDIDTETAQAYGGPVWHVSVWPPSRTRAEAVLSGVGEGRGMVSSCGRETSGIPRTVFRMLHTLSGRCRSILFWNIGT